MVISPPGCHWRQHLSIVHSRSTLLLLTAFASTLVAAEMADYNRGLDAIVTKVQTNNDATTSVKAVALARPNTILTADTVVAESPGVDTLKQMEVDTSAAELASREITLMLQEGKDDGACRDLADSLMKATATMVATVNKKIQDLPDGTECGSVGQQAVEKAQAALDSAVKEATDAAAAAETAAKATINFGMVPLDQITKKEASSSGSPCWTLVGGALIEYEKATINLKDVKQSSLEANAKVVATKGTVTSAIVEAKKRQGECLCTVRKDYNTALDSAKELARQSAPAYAKGKHMQCYLNEISKEKCTVDVPEIKGKTLMADVPQKECDVPRKAEFWIDHATCGQGTRCDSNTCSAGPTGIRACETEQNFIVQFEGGPWVYGVTGMVGATQEQCLAAQVARSTSGYCTPKGMKASDGEWCGQNEVGTKYGSEAFRNLKWGGQINDFKRPSGCFYSGETGKMYFNIAKSLGPQCNGIGCNTDKDYCTLLCVKAPASV